MRASGGEASERASREAVSFAPGDVDALHALGLAAFARDDLNQADAWIARVLAVRTGLAGVLFNLGLVRQRLGRQVAAIDCFDSALSVSGDVAEAWSARGASLQAVSRATEALASQARAIALKPDLAPAFLERGALLRAAEEFEAAAASFGRAYAIAPGYLDALCNQGVLLHDLGHTTQALRRYDAVLVRSSEHPGALYNRAVALKTLAHRAEARVAYARVVALLPDHVDALNGLGAGFRDDDRCQDALTMHDRALAANPASAESHFSRGIALQLLKRGAAALASYDRAIALDTRHARAFCNRGVVLQDRRQFARALESYDAALSIKGDYAEALFNRGNVLHSMNRHGDAVASFERAIALRPDDASVHNNRARSLLSLRRVAETFAGYKRALAIRPSYAEAHSNLIFTQDFDLSMTFRENQLERRRWNEIHCRGLGETIAPHENMPDPSRRLRLGYVSADFMNHSASFAFGPALSRHDRAAFEVTCYSNVETPDERTRHFERLADRWYPIQDLSDEALAAKIRADGIDILVDLSGHTARNRLLAFARKPAPVQVTAWGHPSGTGMPTMDYLLTDPFSIPAKYRSLHAETIVDLPCSITLEPPPDAPDVSALPQLTRGTTTFGSLNRLSKLSEPTIALWAQILAEVPGARLLLKDTMLDDPRARATVTADFARHGLDPSRLDLRGGSSRANHLAALREVDIALDPFPQTGGVTTWEALWMGCPVVTKAGMTVASCGGTAVLHSVGLESWVAADEAAYKALAVRWAGDPKGLADLRGRLRQVVAASDAGNPGVYVRRLEDAYRSMWRTWCERRSPI